MDHHKKFSIKDMVENKKENGYYGKVVLFVNYSQFKIVIQERL